MLSDGIIFVLFHFMIQIIDNTYYTEIPKETIIQTLMLFVFL